MSALDTKPMETALAQRIDKSTTENLSISKDHGGLHFSNMSQVMEFAKMMAIGSVAIPKHLRGNVGACLAVAIQATEWSMSPYAVANKSYSVNDRLSYEASMLHAVVLSRAPIEGRVKQEYIGEGQKRRCRVFAKLKDCGEIVEYVSPETGNIKPKNSPLWGNDPDQQLFYFSVRAWCRRHFPDVIMGVYAHDELDPEKTVSIATTTAPAPKSSAFIDGEFDPPAPTPENEDQSAEAKLIAEAEEATDKIPEGELVIWFGKQPIELREHAMQLANVTSVSAANSAPVIWQVCFQLNKLMLSKS